LNSTREKLTSTKASQTAKYKHHRLNHCQLMNYTTKWHCASSAIGRN